MDNKLLNIGIPIIASMVAIFAIWQGKKISGKIHDKPPLTNELNYETDAREILESISSKKQLNDLEKDRQHATILFIKNNNNKITDKDMTNIRSLKPETLKTFINELENGDLAGAKNKPKYKNTKRKSHSNKKSKRK